METGDLRALLSALLLPPTGLLLLAGVGLAMLQAGRRTGFSLAIAAGALLWLLGCEAVAVRMADALLPSQQPAGLVELRKARTQAIVVLGGGVRAEAPEYREAQPSAYTYNRLRYAARLARQAGLPVAVSGGRGWAGNGRASEADAARAAARQDLGLELRWVENQSRDTGENARNSARQLQRDGVRRIALVTDSWHMPRAALEFGRAGFEVLPAPVGFPATDSRLLLQWLPTPGGWSLSRQVLRELVAYSAARWWPST